jgi:beta-galactosidase
VYEPGTIEVMTYKNGRQWAQDAVRTAGSAVALDARADRTDIAADGIDLSFVTVRVVDRDGLLAPRAKNQIRFTVTGPGEIVATDNGDPTSFTPFQSDIRETFNGLALVIVRARKGETGRITLTASSEGLTDGVTVIRISGGRR